MAQADVSITLCLKLESSANISTALTEKNGKKNVNYTLLEIKVVRKYFNGLEHPHLSGVLGFLEYMRP